MDVQGVLQYIMVIRTATAILLFVVALSLLLWPDFSLAQGKKCFRDDDGNVVRCITPLSNAEKHRITSDASDMGAAALGATPERWWQDDEDVQTPGAMIYTRRAKPDDRGTLYFETGGMMRLKDLAPDSTADSDAYLKELESHSGDPDLKGLHDMTKKYEARESHDTGVVGQAAAVVHNSAVVSSHYSRSDIEAALTPDANSVNQSSSEILQGAQNNTILGEVFSDCQTKTYDRQQPLHYYSSQVRTCSAVRLAYDPGYQGTRVRNVAMSKPHEYTVFRLPFSVVEGGIVTLKGSLSDHAEFPEGVYVLSSFTTHVLDGNLKVDPFYSVTKTVTPVFFNDWTFAVDISSNAHYVPKDALELWVSAGYEGLPVYDFTTSCVDGNCGAVGDEFCKAKWECTSALPQVVDGNLIPASALADVPPLYSVDPADDPTGSLAQTAQVCMSAKQSIDCERIWRGCTPNDPGNPGAGQTCAKPAKPIVLPNDCEAVAKSPDHCRLDTRATTCAAGGKSKISGFCYVKVYTYLCQPVTTIDHTTRTKRTTCAMAKPCLDGSCKDDRYEDLDSEEQRHALDDSVARQLMEQQLMSDWETVDEAAADAKARKAKYGEGP